MNPIERRETFIYVVNKQPALSDEKIQTFFILFSITNLSQTENELKTREGTKQNCEGTGNRGNFFSPKVNNLMNTKFVSVISP